MLARFTVIHDGEEHVIEKALDAQDAATEAAMRIFNDSAGEAFDRQRMKPTRVTVIDEAGEVFTFDVTLDWDPTFFAHKVTGV